MIFPSFRINLIMALAALTLAAVLTACGGSSATSSPTPAPYDPAVSPFSEEQAAPYLEIANPAGDVPCGVFDVNGHGEKIVTVSDYPACDADDYTVYCLTGEAKWTDEFVSDLTVDATGSTVRFTSAQEGICALFPAD